MFQQLKRDFSICCGGLYDADLVDGKVILRCVRCGELWQRQTDGTFQSVAIPKPKRNGRGIMGNHSGTKTVKS